MQSLVTLVREGYRSTLPENYEPRRSLTNRTPDSTISRLIQTCRTATIDRKGFLDVDLTEIGVPNSKLLVRKSYLKLARIVIERSLRSCSFNTLLLGSPGTGKSVFLVFLLYILVQAGNVPILVNIWEKRGLSVGNRFYHLKEAFFTDSDIDLYNPVLLYDGKSPPPYLVRSPTIVASSPRADRYSEFKNRANRSAFLMPLWTEKELSRLNSILTTAEGKISKRRLAERFLYACGVPRVIFDEDWAKYKKAVKVAISGLELEILAKEGDGSLERGPHSVIGIMVDTANYQDFKLCFHSHGIRNEAFEHLKEKEVDLLKFVFNKVCTGHKTGVAIGDLPTSCHCAKDTM